MDARDATVWQLVDERIAELRRRSFADVARLASAEPQTELLDRDGGRYRRRTRVLALGEDRVGVKVAVDAGSRRPRAERGVVLADGGRLAPEWTPGDPPHNPFVAGPRVTVAGLLVAAFLLTLFFVLI